MIETVEVGSVPPGLGDDARTSVWTWREPWTLASDQRATFLAVERGQLPRPDERVRKAQLVGPATLAAFGEPDDGSLPERVARAAARLAGVFPNLAELWIDEPCLAPGTEAALASSIRALRAAAGPLPIGVHTCGPPRGLERSGADVWHGDAERFERDWIDLALDAPTGVEIVWGVVPTDASDALDDIRARIDRIESSTGRRVERLAPACGLGTRSLGVARAVLDQLDRLRAGADQ